MKFSYTFRDGSGSLRSGVVEAASREAAFAAIKAQGISPKAIREGGKGDKGVDKGLHGVKGDSGLNGNKGANGNNGLRRVKGNKGFRESNGIKALVAILAILAVFGVLVYLGVLGVGTGAPTTVKDGPAKPKGMPKEVTPAKPQKAKVSQAKTPKPADVQKQPRSAAAEKPKKALTPEDEGYVSADPTFAERYKRFKEEQAKLPFKHMSELEIHRIISTMPGETVLPAAIHPNFEQDFVEHLDDPIVINDDDSDEVKQDKQTMIAVKASLKKMMKEGQSVREILEAEQDHLVKVMNLRDNLFSELRTIEASAKSLQEVEDYVKAANKMLEEYGAKNIKLPMSPARLRLMKLEATAKEKENK